MRNLGGQGHRRYVVFDDETEIDDGFKNCTELVAIGNFTRLPRGIATLHLTYLNVSGNRLTELPDLSLLTNLTVLHATSNCITTLGPLPPSLEDLNLYDNQISQLPPVAKLRSLELGKNRIAKITLPLDLEFLSIYDNQLSHIDLRNQTKLGNVDLGQNKLERFPKFVVLNWIGIDDNPLMLPNLDYARGVKASKVCAAYFSKQREHSLLVSRQALPIEITYSDIVRDIPNRFALFY